jgi:predicted cupin superfamily sugar epimerase
MYTRVYESKTEVISLNQQQYNNESRRAGTSIYYMLQKEDYSA